MTPQFVDFDADGQTDMVMGTFEGVAFVVPGEKDGFGAFQRIMDRKDQTILISQFWNNDSEEWDSTDRSVPKGEEDKEHHCTSAAAVDWDADGDLDLLLGAYDGFLYLRRNDGKQGEPKFALTNETVKLGDEPLEIPGGLTAPKVVDWNGDKLFDLVCGSPDGGVFLFLNEGDAKEPKFATREVLLDPPGADDDLPKEPIHPIRGCHVDVVDYDEDGDLDLLVGGYAKWHADAKDLTKKQQKKLKKINAKLTELNQVDPFAKLREAADDLSDEERDKLVEEIINSDEFQKHQQQLRKLQAQRDELSPRPQSHAFVWLYRRN